MGSSIWTRYGLPQPTEEYAFAKELGRKFRFDWAWVDLKIAVEQEGAVWVQGRHTRGSGFIKDMEKYNLATKLGWSVFRFTPQELSRGLAQTYMRDFFNCLPKHA